MASGIDRLIINSAYEEPRMHWKYDIETSQFYKESGRRPAGYIIASKERNEYNDQGRFVELPLVNMIRPRVKAWREAGYPNATGTTKKLLAHWHDATARQYQFFFCQLDAIETIIWLTEAPEADKAGINIPGDGGDFRRICTKMCTGSGKTAVMAMLIAWMICNKVSYPQDKRFTKYIFVVAPGLTVKSRLQSLQTGGEDNDYVHFNIVPAGMMQLLRQGIVKVENWQTLAWETEEALKKKKSVDKRGPKSDEAYARSVLGELKKFHNILVINDEAHHAWRTNPEVKVALQGQAKKDYVENAEQATVWVGGLDRINRVRHILSCYDFSATPFAPSGKRTDEEALFGWIVSDFGLNDGIESGLVKTPRVVIRDDGIPTIQGNEYRSKLYHIYADETVKDDINRDAEPTEPLPDLLIQAYYLLGKDWQATYEAWKKQGIPTPPVMISVANRTETAARIENAFLKKRIQIPELNDPQYTKRIDSKILKDAESATGSKKEAAQALRDIIDTVGKIGKPGEQVRNVISVGMLSEGWDARTVTHILGLRAFSSQLLCEQVVGRGLRRTSYDLQEGSDLFTEEYVNIFGIPFNFLPHEEGDGPSKPQPPKPQTQISSLKERSFYEIKWPNIIRFDRVWKPTLTLNIDDVDYLTLQADDTRLRADLAPIIDGKTDFRLFTEIDLEKLDKNLRMQRITFEAAGQVFDQMQASWKEEATKYALLGQIIKLTEQFLKSDKILIEPRLFVTDGLRRRIMLMLNMNKIVRHLWNYIQYSQPDKIVPVYDMNRRVRSTADMITWFTTKPCQLTFKSQISHVVGDSSWEGQEAYILEKNPHVIAYAKNDHLGYEILYTFDGVIHKYHPDFLIQLDNGSILVLEVKGQESEKDRVKRKALAEWVKAVNETHEFGTWYSDVSFNAKDVDGIIAKYCIKAKDEAEEKERAKLRKEAVKAKTGNIFEDSVVDPQIGDRVRHNAFGEGIITEINRHGNWVVKFKDGSEKSFLSSAFAEGFLKIIVD